LVLVEMFVPKGERLVVGIDETLHRRYAKKIAAKKGVYTVTRCVPPTSIS